MDRRPVCPKCGKLAVVVKTKPDEAFRAQSFGCPPCGLYNLGNQVIALSDRRTRIDRATKKLV